MKNFFKTVAVRTTAGTLGLLLSANVFAQSSDEWNWRVIPYLWGVNLDGSMTVGPINADVDVEFSDILSEMDIGGSLFAQFGKGNHGFHFDYTYLRLKPDADELPSPPFFPGSTVSPKLTINMLEAGYNYHATENQTIILGLRWNDLAMKMTPTLTGPAPIEPEPLEEGPSWVDGFIGFQSRTQISENWDFSFYGTVGAGGSDLPWTTQFMFGRKFSNDNRLAMGVRVWGIDYTDNENSLETRANLDVTMFGFLVGYEFN